ncbi:ABC transporter permease [Gordonia soli]|uniref:Transport permease protein n=1 Tax=Gordonia soli NBRC 108243 TaxID=1223545 RepID=M0QPN3_9ACTN|nr:ABC transporter permease [Gordonia soli]GAC70645.1 putative ABC transporter permease protein [Gordonia soli NBRC 108243]
MTSTHTPESGAAAADSAATTSSWPARRSVAFLPQTITQASTLLKSWSRDPGIVVQSLLFPTFMLLMFQLVFGKSVTALGGGSSVYGNTGLVALVGGLYGTVATAMSLINERDSGLLSRMWTLPVARTGFLAGRLTAEAVRTGLSTIVLFLVAMTMSFRFDQGVAAAVGAWVVPMIFAIGVAVPVIAMATVASGPQAIQVLGGVFLFLLFFNTGFAPVSEYPGWLQPAVRYQPMSPAIDAIRGLTEGGAVAGPLLGTIVWTIGLVLVFGPLALRGYRRASEGR